MARNPFSFKHKPQPVPKDFLDLIRSSFGEKYADFLKTKRLIIEGAIYPEEITLLVGFQNNEDKLRQTNFESSMDYTNDENNDVLGKIHLMIDALDAMMTEYIEADGDIAMPTNWTEFDFEKQKIYLKFSTVNTELERLTEQFLRENDGNAVEDTNGAPEDLLH
jgi:hypothetical protein